MGVGLQGGGKPDVPSLRQFSWEGGKEACYLICEMGQYTGMSVDVMPQEFLAQTPF